MWSIMSRPCQIQLKGFKFKISEHVHRNAELSIIINITDVTWKRNCFPTVIETHFHDSQQADDNVGGSVPACLESDTQAH